MDNCSNCAAPVTCWNCDPPPAAPVVNTERQGSVDVVVYRLASIVFRFPARITESGLYVAGENEDGETILTRMPEPD